MVKTLLANARHGFNLWSGKIPHAPHSNQACALDPGSCIYWSPHTLEPVLCNKRSLCTAIRVVPACHSQRKVCSAMNNQHRKQTPQNSLFFPSALSTQSTFFTDNITVHKDRWPLQPSQATLTNFSETECNTKAGTTCILKVLNQKEPNKPSLTLKNSW